MVLLTYSSTYSSSDSLSLVTFWDLILCQTSAYMGSSHEVLIGKRLVGNMNTESEVRFCLILAHHLFVMLEGLYAFLRPFILLKQLLFYILPRVVLRSQSPLPVLYGSAVCYCQRRFCWNTVVKRGYSTHTTQPPSTSIDPTDHEWNGRPSPRALFVFRNMYKIPQGAHLN